MIRFIKRERDILEGKLTVKEQENLRYANNIQTLQRHVDELKTELKKEVEKAIKSSTLAVSGRSTSSSISAGGAAAAGGGGVYNEEEYHKLLADVTQLNILRESNAHLRYENEELLKRHTQLKADYDRIVTTQEPLQATIRTLTR